MGIFGTEDVKDAEVKEIKEVKDYSNKGNEYINESLAAVIELFDKANKNVIIHNLKVTGGEDDSHLDTFKNSIEEKLAAITKKLDEIESASKVNVSQKIEDLEVKLAKISNTNKDKVISTIESGMLATKTEVIRTMKEINNSSKGGGILGYLVTAIIVAAATAGFFLSGLAN